MKSTEGHKQNDEVVGIEENMRPVLTIWLIKKAIPIIETISAY